MTNTEELLLKLLDRSTAGVQLTISEGQAEPHVRVDLKVPYLVVYTGTGIWETLSKAVEKEEQRRRK